jgi:hypothetical protein
VQTAEQGGSCSLPGSYAVAGHTFSLCTAFASGGAAMGSGWTTVQTVVLIAFLVMMALTVFHLVRRVIRGTE